MATRRAAPKRAAPYERVSLDRRDSRRSVDEQHADNLATIEREAWRYVDDGSRFVDNDRSASRYAKKERPGYVRLVSFVDAGRCDVVVVWELSRLSRDLGTLVAFRDLCRARGVLWSVGGRTYDPGDDRDTWPLIAQAIQAENESAQTSKRVRRAMVKNAEKGRPHGKHSYGYRREYDPETRVLVRVVIDEDQAAVLREIADRFLAGEAFYSIAHDLTARGVPAPAGGKVWHPSNCARLMKNPAYIARRMQNGQYVADAIWPPIFGESEWALMQGKLADPARLTTHEAATKYLLTGIAECGVCGSTRMSTVKHRGTGNRSFICGAKFCVSRAITPTEQLVEKKIIERLASPDVADLFGTGGDDDSAEAARKRAAELRERLAGFEAEAMAGRITPAAFGRFETKLTEQIEAAEVEARRAVLPAALTELAGVDPEHVAAVWQAMTIHEKRDALRATGARVTILPVGRGKRIFDPATVRVEFPKRKG